MAVPLDKHWCLRFFYLGLLAMFGFLRADCCLARQLQRFCSCLLRHMSVISIYFSRFYSILTFANHVYAASRLQLIENVALPCISLCINRRLFLITRFRKSEPSTTNVWYLDSSPFHCLTCRVLEIPWNRFRYIFVLWSPATSDHSLYVCSCSLLWNQSLKFSFFN